MRKLRARILDLLRQGITPEKIAMGIALGITLGVTPVIGSTSILCFLAALALRLNLGAVQVVNLLAYPLQLALLIPFLRAGAWVFGVPPLPLALGDVQALAAAGLGRAIATLWTATLHALAVWLVFGALAAPLLYAGLLPVLRRMMKTLT